MILLATERLLAPLTMAVSITRLPATRPLLHADYVRRSGAFRSVHGQIFHNRVNARVADDSTITGRVY